MKMALNVTTALILACLAAVANAENTFSLVAPTSVTVGESFNIQVIGNLPSDILLGGGVIFEFDPDKVSVDDVVNDIPFGVGPDLTDPFFTCPSNCVGANDPSNSIELAWGSFSSGISLASTQMATISLTALETGAATFSLFEDQFNPLSSGLTFAVLSGVQFSGADVQIIPVPAAVWLFGSGLLGLVGMARRNA